MKAESGKQKAESGIFLRHERCRGLRLWKWGRTQWILWFAPKGAEIKDHWHDNMHAAIRLIVGKMTWRKETWGKEGEGIRKTLFMQGLSRQQHWIPLGITHGATAHANSFFLVRETWLGTSPMTSAATDFHTV